MTKKELQEYLDAVCLVSATKKMWLELRIFGVLQRRELKRRGFGNIRCVIASGIAIGSAPFSSMCRPKMSPLMIGIAAADAGELYCGSLGELFWRAPEMRDYADDERVPLQTQASDIWSMGALLYSIKTGYSPREEVLPRYIWRGMSKRKRSQARKAGHRRDR